MCGICGICLNDPGASVSKALLRRMTDALVHRGPDGDGYLMRRHVGFGHRRLSIIDIAGGDQPIFNEDRRIGIVFNGEIYNYVELMEDLIASGHIFRTRSDTEVIVHLYEKHGARCVEHLRGMFAFAIWDDRDESLLLARDRLGIKPLFYAETPDHFCFASELKAIIADPSVRRNVDLQALADYLAYGYVPGESCILQGIRKLQPGYTLTLRKGQRHLRRYWEVAFNARDRVGETEAVGRLDGCLLEAVKLHLRSDVPVGVLLSGGVDSATMVAIASEVSPHPIKTFSIGFAENEYNELPAARLIARRFGTEHHEFVVADRDMDILPKLVWHLDEPFADSSALPTYFVCREAAAHVKVCLSGDGADEVFAGYSRYRRALAYRRFDGIPARVRQLVGKGAAALCPSAMWGKGALERFGSTGCERYFAMVGVFSEAECRTLLAPTGYATSSPTRWLAPYFNGAPRDLLTTLQHADQNTYLPHDILVKVDRMSMTSSLEVRPPFLDHKVVELANAMPAAVKFHKGEGKLVLKSMMRRRIPEETLTRGKRGFTLPIKRWFRGGLEPITRDLLLTPGARSEAFLDRRAVEQVLDGHQRGMRDLSKRIWALLVLEQWLRCFGV